MNTQNGRSRQAKEKKRQQLIQAYKRERTKGFRASHALHNAKTRVEWAKMEWDEHSAPQFREVRLRIVPDDSANFEDLCGDTFNPEVNDNIPASKLEREKQEFLDKVNQDGVWGVVGEYFDGETWQHADSCFGFVGDDWKDSGYDADIMYATLQAAKDTKLCRCCKRPSKHKGAA